MGRMSKEEKSKERDLSIQTQYALNGKMVSIWDLGKIGNEGKRLQSQGKSGLELREGLISYINTLSVG